jgi:hypothetical protein
MVRVNRAMAGKGKSIWLGLIGQWQEKERVYGEDYR